MDDEALMNLMLKIDPETKRIPPGVRAIAHAVEAAERERWRTLVMDYAVMCGELSKGLLADAPEWAELTTLGARVDGPNVGAKA